MVRGEVHGTNLYSTVEETAVLARLVEQAFGEGEGEHAARLVGLSQTATLLLEEFHPCHWVLCPTPLQE